MKNFKIFCIEVAQPKPKGEKDFKDLVMAGKLVDPEGTSEDLTKGVKKASRKADKAPISEADAQHTKNLKTLKKSYGDFRTNIGKSKKEDMLKTAKNMNESLGSDYSSIFDSLKKGDIIKIKYNSSSEGTFKVTFKSVVGKAKVGKVTLIKQGDGASKMKHYLYNRNGKVSFALGDMAASLTSIIKESFEMNESASGYELYHKDFSTAMQHAYKYAKSNLGITVDPEEIDNKVAMGPPKPSNGKTNSYRLVGTDGKKAIQVQVYNMGKSYELNMYKESVDFDESVQLDEALFSPSMITKLKASYKSLPDRLQPEQTNKMKAILKGKDKEALIQIARADIKWLSSIATTQLIIQGVKADEINEELGNNKQVLDKKDLAAVQAKLNTMKNPPVVTRDKNGWFNLRYSNPQSTQTGFHDLKQVLKALTDKNLNESYVDVNYVYMNEFQDILEEVSDLYDQVSELDTYAWKTITSNLMIVRDSLLEALPETVDDDYEDDYEDDYDAETVSESYLIEEIKSGVISLKDGTSYNLSKSDASALSKMLEEAGSSRKAIEKRAMSSQEELENMIDFAKESIK